MTTLAKRSAMKVKTRLYLDSVIAQAASIRERLDNLDSLTEAEGEDIFNALKDCDDAICDILDTVEGC